MADDKSSAPTGTSLPEFVFKEWVAGGHQNRRVYGGSGSPCIVCGKQPARKRQKFCSKLCADSSRKAASISYENHPHHCVGCGTPLRYRQRTQTYCSKSCSAKHMPRSPHSGESKAKISERNRKFAASLTDDERKKQYGRSSQKGVRRRPLRICIVCGGTFDHPNSLKKTCSRACRTLLCIKHNSKQTKTGRGKHGYYKGILCQSTYELAFVIWATDWGLPIRRSTSQIPYIYRGKEHIYIPDFEIDGVTYEIKGKEHPGTRAKASAARKIGDYVFIDRRKIRFYLEYVENMYGGKIEDIYPELYGQKPKYQYTCDNCGAIFSVQRQRKKAEKFCSTKCSGLFRMSQMDRSSGSNNSKQSARRRKLPYDEILDSYKRGGISYASLARDYKCNKSAIGRIIKQG